MITVDDLSLPKFFLGANSPYGFISIFNNLYYPEEGWFAYIIKGGPGTGKSTLMKKLAKEANLRGIDTELIYCSSDPSSLDAVIFSELKISIADGTSPHVLDPVFPGVSDTVINLCDCWNKETIQKNKSKIIELSKINSAYHKKSKKYLCAYDQIDNDIYSLVCNYYDNNKIYKYSKNLTQKYFKKFSSKTGKENVRFISGITPEGVVFFEDTLEILADKTIIIEDEYGMVGNTILSIIRDDAINSGFDLFSCYCPTKPNSKLETIIIPELRLAFTVSNNYHNIKNLKDTQVIHSKRFLNTSSDEIRKQRIGFDNKLKHELINESISNLEKAKSTHDELESLYSMCMDYNKINLLTEKLKNNIFK